MTDQDPKYESNQGHQGLPEGAVQPPMATPVPENAIQPSTMGPNPENPAQWPMIEQGSEKPVPNTGLLTFVFFLNIGYLGLFIGSALMVGGWAIAFLFFLGLHLISYIIATVLLGIGRIFASKEILFVSVAFFFISMFLAGDPDWFLFRIPSIISTILVLIGTLLL
ncbi:hypothetical protein [Streptococcus sp. 400_SSPC]|uniref:hypothetical protein n=1 Tax=Streptococcus sp. 400_SSPC TaxID=1579341 RepID=UPI00069E56B8|nr:hypothetical protein [Streptococcus sp. 400_SSPC]